MKGEGGSCYGRQTSFCDYVEFVEVETGDKMEVETASTCGFCEGVHREEVVRAPFPSSYSGGGWQWIGGRGRWRSWRDTAGKKTERSSGQGEGASLEWRTALGNTSRGIVFGMGKLRGRRGRGRGRKQEKGKNYNRGMNHGEKVREYHSQKMAEDVERRTS